MRIFSKTPRKQLIETSTLLRRENFFKKSPPSLIFTALFAIFVASVYGVNVSNKLLICSHFFVFSLLLSLAIAEVFSKKTAIMSTVAGLFINALLYGTAFRWMHVFSFFGLFCGIYVGVDRFSAFKINTGNALFLRLFLTLSFSILVDAFMMLPWEIYTFSGDRLLNVIGRSLMYKFSYAALMSIGVSLLLSLKNKGVDNLNPSGENVKHEFS